MKGESGLRQNAWIAPVSDVLDRGGGRDSPKPPCWLRPSNIDAGAGSVEEVARIVGQIRTRWPKTRILLRADSGFAREALMA